MSAILIWRPEAFNLKLIAAARPAAAEVAVAARVQAARASRRVAASVYMTGSTTNFLIGSASPLATLFERGVGPHEIKPRRAKVLAGALGHPVGEPVQHPGMAAKPFLRPSLALWPTLYRRAASVALRGF